MTDTLERCRPRNESSAAHYEAIANIASERQTLEAQKGRPQTERSEMLIDGSVADIRRVERALADVELEIERLNAAMPTMERRRDAAIAREAAVTKGEQVAAAHEAVTRFNTWLASGAYLEAVALIKAGPRTRGRGARRLARWVSIGTHPYRRCRSGGSGRRAGA